MKIVLLAAGFGSRLWPLSTSEKPKQFQTLLGEQSLLQYTYSIFSKIAPVEDIHILTLKGLEHWVYEQIPSLPEKNVVIVPERRNTLPHVIFALRTITQGSDEPVLFSGTDVYVTDQPKFIEAVEATIRDESSKRSNDVTLIGSSSPRVDTNAGHLQVIDGRVTKYLEKPDKDTITQLSKAAPLYKNMFTFTTSLDGIKQMLPTMDESIARVSNVLIAVDGSDLTKAFLDCPMADISNAAFAHANNLAAVACESDFIDLGSFATLHQINEKDENNNVINGEVYLEGDCHDNFIYNNTGKPIVVIDTSRTAVVQTPDGSLFSPMNQSSRVGEVYKKQIHGQH